MSAETSRLNGKRNKAAAIDPAAMTLMEHLRELRTRLFRASLAIVFGFAVGFWLSSSVKKFIQSPYCDMSRTVAIHNNNGVLPTDYKCTFVQLGVGDGLTLSLKIALWVGLLIAAPIWLYQLWAFIAPGLHKHERKWAYWFTGIAAPLFGLGAALAFVVVSHGLSFILQFNGPDTTVLLDVTKYFSFITNFMLIFGVAFEFPLVILLFSFSGMMTGRKMLGWWRVAVFLLFAFSAIATPTADPFGMTFLALALCALYFGAVGIALINDRRRRRKERASAVHDDEASPLDLDGEEIIDRHAEDDVVQPVAPARPLENRYDDMT